MSFALDTPGCVISDPGLWTNVTTFVALALGVIFGFCKLGLLLHCLGHVLTPRVHRGGGGLLGLSFAVGLLLLMLGVQFSLRAPPTCHWWPLP